MYVCVYSIYMYNVSPVYEGATVRAKGPFRHSYV